MFRRTKFSLQSVINNAVALADGYNGGYSILAPKSFNKDWYCSLVVWKAYIDASPWWNRADLDGDGGYAVTPGDLRWSPRTYTIQVYVK